MERGTWPLSIWNAYVKNDFVRFFFLLSNNHRTFCPFRSFHIPFSFLHFSCGIIIIETVQLCPLLHCSSCLKNFIDFVAFHRNSWELKIVLYEMSLMETRGQHMASNLLDEDVLCAFCTKPANKTCGRCGEFYCSIECQLFDWRNHRFICIPLP